ncbi:hypothetical protein CVT26_015903 [Gymnopilus dilepis]|uniref:Uncharacterized protein n=1 Tax=Gymnopilus dilepis TaxID=231916 RepID=A0A409WHJ3_9AGAR|nr:hypothetical protein CVT26_015903 [Gymnopilus dilepis]
MEQANPVSRFQYAITFNRRSRFTFQACMSIRTSTTLFQQSLPTPRLQQSPSIPWIFRTLICVHPATTAIDSHQIGFKAHGEELPFDARISHSTRSTFDLYRRTPSSPLVKQASILPLTRAEEPPVPRSKLFNVDGHLAPHPSRPLHLHSPTFRHSKTPQSLSASLTKPQHTSCSSKGGGHEDNHPIPELSAMNSLKPYPACQLAICDQRRPPVPIKAFRAFFAPGSIAKHPPEFAPCLDVLPHTRRLCALQCRLRPEIRSFSACYEPQRNSSRVAHSSPCVSKTLIRSLSSPFHLISAFLHTSANIYHHLSFLQSQRVESGQHRRSPRLKRLRLPNLPPCHVTPRYAPNQNPVSFRQTETFNSRVDWDGISGRKSELGWAVAMAMAYDDNPTEHPGG